MTTLYDFSAETLDGKPAPLAEHQGKVVLIVNTASKCGFTPQYAGLEALWSQYKDRGLVVLEVNAVPGWKALASVTGVDVAGAILSHLREAGR